MKWIFILLLLFPFVTFAQEEVAAEATAKTSAEQAAEEYIALWISDEENKQLAQRFAREKLNSSAQNNNIKLACIPEDLRKEYQDYVWKNSYPYFHKLNVKVIVQYFSEAELHELLRFYKSPVGRKVLIAEKTKTQIQVTQGELDIIEAFKVSPAGRKQKDANKEFHESIRLASNKFMQRLGEKLRPQIGVLLSPHMDKMRKCSGL